ncbi:hypothetical protein D3C73_1451300 [compost metagenome]
MQQAAGTGGDFSVVTQRQQPGAGKLHLDHLERVPLDIDIEFPLSLERTGQLLFTEHIQRLEPGQDLGGPGVAAM